MQEYELELHPEKTKMVYCKNYQRLDKHENESFTFLSYSFQPRTVKSKFGKGKRLLVFGAAICNAAKTNIRTAIKTVPVSYTHLDVYKRQILKFPICSHESKWEILTINIFNSGDTHSFLRRMILKRLGMMLSMCSFPKSLK